jgi:hypothetical protein
MYDDINISREQAIDIILDLVADGYLRHDPKLKRFYFEQEFIDHLENYVFTADYH